jgi:hypothetical protein
MRKLLEVGGLIAGVVLIAFGVGAIALSVNGKSTIHNNLAAEGIVGTPDMTPTAIKAAAKEAGLDVSKITIPSESVAGLAINNGSRAHSFAQYMRIHALEASGGLPYAAMGRFIAAPTAPKSATDGNGGTSDPKYALTDPKTKQPVENGARNVWVTETALTTALNLAYTAQQIALFGLVVGIALLLSGVGFLVLALGGALENERLFWALKPKGKKASSPAVA